MDTETTFVVLRSAILVIPPLAVGAFVLARRRWRRARSPIFYGCVLLFLLVLVAVALRIGLTSPVANSALPMLMYWAYCYLAISCWYVRSIYIRAPILIVASVPVVVGYWLGTAGLLVLAFLSHTPTPKHTEDMSIGLTCRITDWGMAASESGYTVGLVRHWNFIPFIERTVESISVDETIGDPTATCADAWSAYAKRIAK